MDTVAPQHNIEETFDAYMESILADPYIEKVDAVAIVHELRSTRELLLYRTADLMFGEEDADDEDATQEYMLCTRSVVGLPLEADDDISELLSWGLTIGVRITPHFYDMAIPGRRLS